MQQPHSSHDNGRRADSGTDPGDLATGAVWSGTSFAPAVLAGLVAGALAEQPRRTGDPGAARRGVAAEALASAVAAHAGRGWGASPGSSR